MSSSSEMAAEKFPKPIPVDAPLMSGSAGGLEFSTRVSVEARRLCERDAMLGRGAGRKQGWAWHTRAEYEHGAVQPHSSYCDYLQAKTSNFWSNADTMRLNRMPWSNKRA